MAKKNLKGFFITLEGPEGSGKSTQSEILCEFLLDCGYNIVHLREPGGTKLGELIRGILLNTRNVAIASEAEAFLYLAARTELVQEKIIPALASGKIVICDRFADATLAYQGYGLGVDKKLLHKLNNFATKSIKPDLTLLFDLKPSTGLTRLKKMKGFKDRIEERSLIFHNKVRKGYLDLAKKNPKRIKVISVEKQNKQDVTKRVQEIVTNAISKNRK